MPSIIQQPPFLIRPYRDTDAAPLLALFKDTIRRINCRDYCPDQIATWAPDAIPLAAWRAKLAARKVLVAEMTGAASQVAGFTDLEPDGHLDRFYISADQQRRGIGRALLTAILTHAAEARIERVFTEASMTARPFFLAQGFRELTSQIVVVRGVAFLNYRLEKLAPFSPNEGTDR